MKTIIIFLLGVSLYTFSCAPKCATCPGMKPNKYQKKAMKQERQMDKKSRKAGK